MSFFLIWVAFFMMFDQERAFSDTKQLSNAPTALLDKFDHEFLKQLEQNVRAVLDDVAKKQKDGIWTEMVTKQKDGIYPDWSGMDKVFVKDLKTYPNGIAIMYCRKYSKLLKFGYAYRTAYHVFGDPKYLQVLKNTGDYLVKIQFERGHWPVHIFLNEDGTLHQAPENYGRRNYLRIQDNYNEEPTAFLIWLYRETNIPDYKKAAVRCLDLMHEAQNGNGMWPGRYNVVTRKGDISSIPRIKEFRLNNGSSELNDGATNNALKLMLLGYHFTKDSKYIQKLDKLGDFLEKSKLTLPNGVIGWAYQYDLDAKPAWARSHEVPFLRPLGSTKYVIPLLYELYLLTGNKKHLALAKKASESLLKLEAPVAVYYSNEGLRAFAVDYKITTCKTGSDYLEACKTSHKAVDETDKVHGGAKGHLALIKRLETESLESMQLYFSNQRKKEIDSDKVLREKASRAVLKRQDGIKRIAEIFFKKEISIATLRHSKDWRSIMSFLHMVNLATGKISYEREKLFRSSYPYSSNRYE